MSKLPKTRRSFNNEWDELGYTCSKAYYWIIIEGNSSRAAYFIKKIKFMLATSCNKSKPILSSTAKFLIYMHSRNRKKTIASLSQEHKKIMNLYGGFDNSTPKSIIKFALNGYSKREIVAKYSAVKLRFEELGWIESVPVLEALIASTKSIKL